MDGREPTDCEPWKADFDTFSELFSELSDDDRRIVVEFSRLFAALSRRRRRATRRQPGLIIPKP